MHMCQTADHDSIPVLRLPLGNLKIARSNWQALMVTVYPKGDTLATMLMVSGERRSVTFWVLKRHSCRCEPHLFAERQLLLQ